MTPQLRFARHVERRHGTIFMQALAYGAGTGELLYDAFALTGVVEYPSDEEDASPAILQFESIEEEIVRRTILAIEEAITSAFVTVARDVIERERRRQKAERRTPKAQTTKSRASR